MKKLFCGIAILVMLAVPACGRDEIYDEPLREGSVTRSNVNVRAAPSTKAKILAVFNQDDNRDEYGTHVSVHELSEHEDRYWCKIQLPGDGGKKPVFGWIAAEFVKLGPSGMIFTEFPKEIFGLTVGMHISEIEKLVGTKLEKEKKDEEDDSPGYTCNVPKKLKLGELELDEIHCTFDAKDRLRAMCIHSGREEDNLPLATAMFVYAMETFGEVEAVSNGGDGMVAKWVDEDTGHTLDLYVIVHPYQFCDLWFNGW